MQREDILLNIDAKGIKDGIVEISGWAVGASETPLRFFIRESGGKDIPFTFDRVLRPDVSQSLFGDDSRKDAGFTITFPGDPGRTYVIVVSDGKNSKKNRFRVSGFTSDWKYRPKALLTDLKRYRSSLPGVIRDEGIRRFMRYSVQKAKLPEYAYHCRLKKTDPTQEELERQRTARFEYEPLFSLVVPAFRTPRSFLLEMIASVQAQTYGKFELCIADGSYPETEVAETLSEAAGKDSRIRYVVLDRNLGISGNTNEAMKLAKGDYIVLMDHDDLLRPDALFELAKAAEDKPRCIYTDEDKITADLFMRYQPAFKPDFDPVLLTANNYVCHLFAVRSDVAEKAGPFDPKTDGSQDHDFILRCTELGSVKHVPKAVYHWRSHPGSTAGGSANKSYTSEAGVKAVEKAYRRSKKDAVVLQTRVPGHYSTIFAPFKDEPLISVILSSAEDQAAEITRKSILEASPYRNYEFVSDVREAKGDFYFFLPAGSTVSCDRADNFYAFPYNLIARLNENETGLVGTKIVDRDLKIRFAGALLHPKHGIDRVLYGQPENTDDLMARVLDARTTSAVSAESLFVKREVFEKAGGFDGTFSLLRGEDLSLSLLKGGLRSVYEPAVTVRVPAGNGGSPFFMTVRSESDRLIRKHAGVFGSPDPNGNPNLAIHLDEMIWSI
ncbi:MAG: glycosyltransferase [Lachnospiraceae bacterium]|nr:glycosyltransferase [Lachnospiraceae bacterium]